MVDQMGNFETIFLLLGIVFVAFLVGGSIAILEDRFHQTKSPLQGDTHEEDD